MIYSVYDPATGQILFTINDASTTDMPDNAIADRLNDRDHYVDVVTRTVVAKPAQPTADHEWNHDTKTWQLNLTQAASTARQQRNRLLSFVDRVNPVWYAELTAQQQTDLANYRLSLLAVPQQTGFPTTIEWPSRPTWL